MRTFFVDLLGFKVVGEMDKRDEPELSTVTGLPGATCRWAMLQCDHGLTHICFQVKDAEEAHRRMVAAGYEPLSQVLSLRGGRAKPFYCKGPEGLIVEFVEYPMGA
jgi:catechol 2,3-dioxygenase-like lactoylglutathione lyase family enzyme